MLSTIVRGYLEQLDGLEQPPEAFYSRLNNGEPEAVGKIVDSLKSYISEQVGEGNYLVAGVGGIFRLPHPGMAQDIDLAVVGLNYTSKPASQRTHDFDHVTAFTRTVQEYFERLHQKLVSEFGLNSQEAGFDRRGSGSFAHWDKKYSLGTKEEEPLITTLESDLESFGWWNSKGLRVCFPAIRPIDVQFVFNQNPEEWIQNQRTLKEEPSKTRRKISEYFPYAILS